MNNNSPNKTIKKVSKLAVGVNMVRATSDKQNSRTFQGHFKDKSQFSRTKINAINRHSLTPL